MAGSPFIDFQIRTRVVFGCGTLTRLTLLAGELDFTRTLVVADEGIVCEDLGSTNGTFVDGERIAGSGALPVGSVLKVGNVSFRHQLRTSADV